MRKTAFVLAPGAVAVMAAAGCSTLGRAAFADPVVTLKNVNVVGLGLTGGNLDVGLNGYNPNGYRLRAPRLHHRGQIESTPLANGPPPRRFTVQNKDPTQGHIPITFSWSRLCA